MTVIEFILRQPSIVALAWALVHFLWQGALLAGIAAVLLRIARLASASMRYAIGAVTMVAMVGSVGVTWTVLIDRDHSASPTAVSLPSASAGFAAANVPRGSAALHRPSIQSVATREAGVAPESGPRVALSVFILIYAIGVAVLSIRLVGGWVLARRMTRAFTAPASHQVMVRAGIIAERLRLPRLVRVLESSVVTAPAVIGWIAPVVLLPAAALAGLSIAQLDALLAHELAHVQRHDYLVNVVQSAIETLLFYHPAVWWVSRQVRIEREHCCDDIAIEACGDRLAYASALVDLETMRKPVLVLAATDGSLLSRVRRILAAPAEPRSNAPGWIGIALVVVMAVAPIAIRAARAESAKLIDHANAQIAPKPATASTSAKPSTPAAAPAAPVIHVSDTLHIAVENDPTLSRNYAVQSDGVIVFPLIRPVKVVGMTTDAVAALIVKALTPVTAKSGAPVNPQVAEHIDSLRNALDDAEASAAEARDGAARLAAYDATNPSTNIETSGMLAEPEVRSDDGVIQAIAKLRGDRAELEKDQKIDGLGANHPSVKLVQQRIAEGVTALRLVVADIVDAAKKRAQIAESRVATAQARFDSYLQMAGDPQPAGKRGIGAAPPRVTVTIVKPGAIKVPVSVDMSLVAPMSLAAATESAPVASTAALVDAQPQAAPDTVERLRSLGYASGGATAPILATAPQSSSVACPAVADTPRPGTGLKNPMLTKEMKPTYPDSGQSRDLRGIVDLEITVMPDGTTCGATVTKSLDRTPGGLDERAIEASKGWRFTAGMKDGVAVPVRVGIEMTFGPDRILVTGEVKQPGEVMLRGPMTVNRALEMAGGATADAGPEVHLLRLTDVASADPGLAPNSRATSVLTVIPLNYEDLRAGRIEDPVLGPLDTVYVPRAAVAASLPPVTQSAPVQTVIVNGEVRTPKAVEWREGLTVGDALATCDGPTDKGAANRLTLTRQGANGKREGVKGVKLTTVLQPGDVVMVPKKYFGGTVSDPMPSTVRAPDSPRVILVSAVMVPSVVVVEGEVKNPGKVDLKDGMTAGDAMTAAGGLTFDAAPKRISIKRLSDDGKKTEEIKNANLTTILHAGDVVRVPRQRIG